MHNADDTARPLRADVQMLHPILYIAPPLHNIIRSYRCIHSVSANMTNKAFSVGQNPTTFLVHELDKIFVPPGGS